MGKSGVTLELDKPRTLRYGMNALVKVEEMLGKPITKLDFDNISIKDLRTIVYSGLYHEDNTLSPETVGDLIDEYSEIGIVAEKLGEAVTLAFGKGNAKRPAAKNKSGTGRNS